jgi:hypothetical protein
MKQYELVSPKVLDCPALEILAGPPKGVYRPPKFRRHPGRMQSGPFTMILPRIFVCRRAKFVARRRGYATGVCIVVAIEAAGNDCDGCEGQD